MVRASHVGWGDDDGIYLSLFSCRPQNSTCDFPGGTFQPDQTFHIFGALKFWCEKLGRDELDAATAGVSTLDY